MNLDPSNWTVEQSTVLKRLRLRWGLTLIVNAPLPFVALPITGSNWVGQQPGQAAANAMMFSIVFGVAALAIGMFTRNQIYKANWKGEVVSPAGYLKANVIFFIAVTVGAFAIFLLGVLNRYPAPTFAAAPIVIGLLVFNFPTGKPMRPALPRIDVERDLQ